MVSKAPIIKGISDLILAIVLFLFFIGTIAPETYILGAIGASVAIVVNLYYLIKKLMKR